MSQALYIHGSPSTYDEIEASQWQATQVSTISFMNFLGRVLIGTFPWVSFINIFKVADDNFWATGLLSDFVKARFEVPRSYLLVLVSGIVLSSQLAASRIDEVSDLWKSSALLGLGYGSVFSLYAAICIEWFGLRELRFLFIACEVLTLATFQNHIVSSYNGNDSAHFSENWGYLSLSPLFGGNIFSVAFGRNLDAHESPVTSPAAVTELPVRQCLDGRLCYVDSLQLTIGACLLSMLLSVWAAWRDRRRSVTVDGNPSVRRPEVIWEEDEE